MERFTTPTPEDQFDELMEELKEIMGEEPPDFSGFQSETDHGG